LMQKLHPVDSIVSISDSTVFLRILFRQHRPIADLTRRRDPSGELRD
jgi:hypothetical protein